MILVLVYFEEKMLYPARWKKRTVDQSKVLKNRLFRFCWATQYSIMIYQLISCWTLFIIILIVVTYKSFSWQEQQPRDSDFGRVLGLLYLRLPLVCVVPWRHLHDRPPLPHHSNHRHLPLPGRVRHGGRGGHLWVGGQQSHVTGKCAF